MTHTKLPDEPFSFVISLPVRSIGRRDQMHRPQGIRWRSQDIRWRPHQMPPSQHQMLRRRNQRTPDNRRGAQYPLLDILDDSGPPRSKKMTDIWAKIAGKSEEKSDIWAQIGRFQERVAQWLSVDKIESDHEFEPASQKSDFKAVDAARGENHEKMRP